MSGEQRNLAVIGADAAGVVFCEGFAVMAAQGESE
jgi:hypothetical protein